MPSADFAMRPACQSSLNRSIAPRTSRSALLNSSSFSRRTVVSAYGRAAAARIETITSVTSNSIRLSPREPERLLDNNSRCPQLRIDRLTVADLELGGLVHEIGDSRA